MQTHRLCVPRYRQGTFVHNRPARKVRRHGDAVAVHVQHDVFLLWNGDDLIRGHPGDIARQDDRGLLPSGAASIACISAS